ncbi:hypothetical protein LINPERHAP2_LOCUS37199 [Linum perenne]
MQEDAALSPSCPRIIFSEEEICSFYKPWSKALVVKVLEKLFSFLTVKRRLESLWARSGNIQVCDLANNFFLVRFSNEQDYQRAAFEGPWKIYDYYLAVSRWTPAFSDEEPIKKILTWVRLPKLPIHFFNKVAVTRIGNCIGRTVQLDLATAEGARARYARVCVEIDLTKPLLGKYSIDGRILLIEYESLENICFGCGAYGHKIGDCPVGPASLETEVTVNNEPSPSEPSDAGQTAGDWMVVQRRQRRKNPKPVTTATKSQAKGYRFDFISPKERTVDSVVPPKATKPSPVAATSSGVKPSKDPMQKPS